ncbi:hypothetical protein EDEG_03744 [Edhazardia aedis USNM 41457]|uniref:Uncharacterized protein n=1 Tax=Edhazardia aedis (strain USNM 41457) TaxID=1003232 RepID=J9D2D5_EDHAE|nr:hypothetical protein EDEG_03744 [Edhazardia aedis USNM 41457]|eukprot:EJW01739.1 hypothetical protein EDEG_03744 [Edhazardia aedis USNM 41457]
MISTEYKQYISLQTVNKSISKDIQDRIKQLERNREADTNKKTQENKFKYGYGCNKQHNKNISADINNRISILMRCYERKTIKKTRLVKKLNISLSFMQVLEEIVNEQKIFLEYSGKQKHYVYANIYGFVANRHN